MNQNVILSLPRLPARLNVEQAASLLGFAEHDIPVLIRARLLKPLGNPPPNGNKYFSSAELETLARDHDWLNKATRAVTQHWRRKNEQRPDRDSNASSARVLT